MAGIGSSDVFQAAQLNRRTDKIMREVEGVFTPNELREAFGKEPMQENIKYLDADRSKRGRTEGNKGGLNHAMAAGMLI